MLRVQPLHLRETSSNELGLGTLGYICPYAIEDDDVKVSVYEGSIVFMKVSERECEPDFLNMQ